MADLLEQAAKETSNFYSRNFKAVVDRSYHPPQDSIPVEDRPRSLADDIDIEPEVLAARWAVIVRRTEAKVAADLEADRAAGRKPKKLWELQAEYDETIRKH